MSRGLLYHSMWEYINHVIDCDAINVQINKCLGSTSQQRGWQNLDSRDFSHMSH